MHTAEGGSAALGTVEYELQQRRAALASQPGIKGLIQNGRTSMICVFASMGGLIYGYNQGAFGQILSMESFSDAAGTDGISNATLAGLLTSILELGAWVGVLINGYSADKLGRKLSVVVACFVFAIGVIVQACTRGGHYSYILGGRFVTGLGVGSLSMIVPLYNAELAPPECRGGLVALQQLAITFGIMVAFWLTYGTNFIGGTGDSQSSAAWLLPITIQLVPALILAVGINFCPTSPRWLINQGRDEECLQVLAGLRRTSTESLLVQMEYLEMKAQRLFETRVSEHDHPHLQNSPFKLGIAAYKSLVSYRPNLRRTAVSVLVMTFQQWTGASGVVGVVMFLATIPAVLFLDQWGRKPVLIVGAITMGLCHFIVAGIIGTCQDDWLAHRAAGWAAAVFIWIFAIGFGFSWGPTAWVIISEVWPLSLRAKGVSIGASANWLNNFAVAMSTPDFVDAAPYGVYIFLGAMCILSVVYVFFMVPETKNRTLEELDALFGDKSDRASWEAGVLLIAQREVGLLRLANIDDSFGGGGSGEKDNRSVDSGSGKEKHPDTVSHREHA